MDYAIIKKILRDSLRLDHVEYRQVPVLTVAHDSNRSFFFDGRYYSPLIDTLEDDLRARGVDCLSTARVISTIKGDNAYGDVRSPEGGFARALVQKRIVSLFSRGKYPYSSWEERVWGDILDSVGAKRLVGVLPSRELCVAAHRRGVWVADMQHGVIASQHPWYGATFRRADPPEHLPDAILCWDQGSAEAVREWTVSKGVATPVIGNRWLSRFRHDADGDQFASRVIAAFPDLPLESNQRRTVLLSLSWGEAEIPNGFIAEPLERAIRRTSDRLRWLIRLHPNQIIGFATDEGPRFKAYFDKALSGHAEWEWPTRAPLPIVLRKCDAHISWTSSVAIEASLAGIRTALLNPRLRTSMSNYFGYFRSAGTMDMVDPEEGAIVAWLEANVTGERCAALLDQGEAAYSHLLAFLSGESSEPPREGK